MSGPLPYLVPRLRVTAILLGAIALIAVGCGDDAQDADAAATAGTDPTADTDSTAPPDANLADPPSGTPAEWCENGQVPQAVAYDLDDGALRWVSCTDGVAYRFVTAVTDQAVFLEAVVPTATGVESIALDPADGRLLVDAPSPPTTGARAQLDVDGVTIVGSQEGPIKGTDGNGVQWSQPGVWAYDDIWAIDDGAVFAIERAMGPGETTRLVAYEVSSGEVRWEYAGDPYGEGLWPWHAEDGRLYTVWSNVQVRDTGSGDVIWATEYPTSQLDRFAGVAVDDDTLFVGFATAASGGD